ncbi:MAG TPA: GTPase ObgE [Candidatus Omnitrophota bacterium]|nr:GTPase ObgE [Candidatus Omnitrophota bacterium]
MIFVDEAKIFVKAGDGGKGCESFYRDKYTRYPRADGGDGGRGGDVSLVASKSVHTLLDFKYQQHFKASKGGNGSSKGKTGREGQDCIIRVPLGTMIRDAQTDLLMKDLVEDGQQVVVAKGGKGGIGNKHKRIPAPPEAGEERWLHLELKLIADVGIIGFPNAGKSTLISSISKVRSKIANYPFTTKQPILGIVFGEDSHFIVADLPGIIEGAHQGKGLGDRFLKHAERTKVLVHLIDMAGSEGRDPLDDYEKVNHEIEQYSGPLIIKHKIVVANKMDLPQAQEHLKRFKKKYGRDILAISSLQKEGLDQLIKRIQDILCTENSPAK